jgi:hypothetical protein
MLGDFFAGQLLRPDKAFAAMAPFGVRAAMVLFP